MYLWWSLCTLYLHPCHIRVTIKEDVPLVEFMYLVFTPMPHKNHHKRGLVEFMYLVFTRMPGESYRTRGCTSGGVYVTCILMHAT